MKNNKQDKWTRRLADRRRATEKEDVTLNLLEQQEKLDDAAVEEDLKRKEDGE